MIKIVYKILLDIKLGTNEMFNKLALVQIYFVIKLLNDFRIKN